MYLSDVSRKKKTKDSKTGRNEMTIDERRTDENGERTREKEETGRERRMSMNQAASHY